MQYCFSQFSSQLSGNEVSMTVETVADGSLNLDPIQGDMLCSYSSSPQVTVFVNDIPARCSASSLSTGCSFNWIPTSTPIINSCSTSKFLYYALSNFSFLDTSHLQSDIILLFSFLSSHLYIQVLKEYEPPISVTLSVHEAYKKLFSLTLFTLMICRIGKEVTYETWK